MKQNPPRTAVNLIPTLHVGTRISKELIAIATSHLRLHDHHLPANRTGYLLVTV
jgi:hypothetical protein